MLCTNCGKPLHPDPQIAALRQRMVEEHEIECLCIDIQCQRFVRPRVAVIGCHKQNPQVVTYADATGHNYDTKGRVV